MGFDEGTRTQGNTHEESTMVQTKQEGRGYALSAARASLRDLGRNPVTETAQNALAVLDDMARQTPDLEFAKWYKDASENQLKLFGRDWRRWQREHERMHSGRVTNPEHEAKREEFDTAVEKAVEKQAVTRQKKVARSVDATSAWLNTVPYGLEKARKKAAQYLRGMFVKTRPFSLPDQVPPESIRWAGDGRTESSMAMRADGCEHPVMLTEGGFRKLPKNNKLDARGMYLDALKAGISAKRAQGAKLIRLALAHRDTHPDLFRRACIQARKVREEVERMQGALEAAESV